MPLYRYNANIFAVEPKSDIVPLEQDLDDACLSHDSYRVYNIGRTDVHVELMYGSRDEWEKTADECVVKPGHAVILDNVGKLFRLSVRYGIRLCNKCDKRAVVHCSEANGIYPSIALKEPGVFDRDYSKNLRQTFLLGLRHVPYMTEKYDALLNTFWPSNQLNVWEFMLFKLQPLINDDILQKLQGIVNNMSYIETKLRKLSRQFSKGNCFVEMYMELAEDLSELEKRFILSEDDTNCKTENMLLLPLLSYSVMVKVIYYTVGIITSAEIGLSATDISHLKNRLKDSVKGANKYINDMSNDFLDYTYCTSQPEDLYDNMMNVRSYTAIHGTELRRIWDHILHSPFAGGEVYNDVISYSTFFGRQTPNLIREATCPKMYPPLTPVYIGFICNYLTSIEAYLWTSCSPSEGRKIGGMKLVFADHSSYIMGTKTEESEKIVFQKAYITRLQVTGNGAVDSCTFFMSDGRTFFFGTREKDSEEEIFELKGHRIVSIFLSSDNVTLKGQAANIAVSYRLND